MRGQSQEQPGLMWQRTPVILRQEDHQVQTGLDNQVMTSSQQKKKTKKQNNFTQVGSVFSPDTQETEAGGS